MSKNAFCRDSANRGNKLGLPVFVAEVPPALQAAKILYCASDVNSFL